MDWSSLYGKMTVGLLQGLLQGLWLCRHFLALVGLVYLVKYAVRVAEQRRIAASGIDEIDRMDGLTFEKYLETLFTRLGYHVERTRYVGDYGADLVTRKDGVKTVIQGKRYKSKVGVKAVQEAVAAKGMYGCTAAMVVTNSVYTRQAVELARANDVILWDRDRLLEALLSLRKEEPKPVAPPPAAVLPAAPAPTVELPSVPEEAVAPVEAAPAPLPCATCGNAVTEKVRAYCEAHPERFQGQVYCYDHQRNSRRTAALR